MVNLLVFSFYNKCILHLIYKYANKKKTFVYTYYSVVIDYPKDEDNVSTGRFELVYEKDFS